MEIFRDSNTIPNIQTFFFVSNTHVTEVSEDLEFGLGLFPIKIYFSEVQKSRGEGV